MNNFKLLWIWPFLALVGACSTDIEVIAPKKDVTVIYGLLEANQMRHYIRINKTFIGEDSASVLAATRGINEYSEDELKARIIELDQNENPTGLEWVLLPTYYYSKDKGNFANDSNKVYYFDATLNVNLKYKIECIVAVEGQDLKVVTAITDIIGSQSSTNGLEQIILVEPKTKPVTQERELDEVKLVDKTGTDYLSEVEIQWKEVNQGVRYTSYARFYYRDIYSNGNIYKDSVLLFIGTKEFKSGEQIAFKLNSVDWYQSIAKAVSDHDTADHTFYRIASDTLQYFLEVADNELATYIRINQPNSNILLDRPEYTNVSNGIGIFASRIKASTRTGYFRTEGRIVDKPSLEELLYSNAVNSKLFTASKGFIKPGRCTYDAVQQWHCQ